ncbi:hypothetical protein C9374_006927 [Naegleria lovaniensis]|uniref:Uncharacterized protein n=1 Tax=Naegleria lovaniensis TaxID=51637 RepID=A0AA88KRL3_NAELO|nr:uncharacterized protein C9374_006927 [Naegleria lovaniensis]KAG2393396.1 hypothetical protein C9374_006927 [Naegleria lovaniensis]
MLNQQQGKRTITNSSRTSLTKSSITSSSNATTVVSTSSTTAAISGTTNYNSRTATTSHHHNGAAQPTSGNHSVSNHTAPTTTAMTMNFGRPVPATFQQKTTNITNNIPTVTTTTKPNFFVPPKFLQHQQPQQQTNGVPNSGVVRPPTMNYSKPSSVVNGTPLSSSMATVQTPRRMNNIPHSSYSSSTPQKSSYRKNPLNLVTALSPTHPSQNTTNSLNPTPTKTSPQLNFTTASSHTSFQNSTLLSLKNPVSNPPVRTPSQINQSNQPSNKFIKPVKTSTNNQEHADKQLSHELKAKIEELERYRSEVEKLKSKVAKFETEKEELERSNKELQDQLTVMAQKTEKPQESHNSDTMDDDVEFDEDFMTEVLKEMGEQESQKDTNKKEPEDAAVTTTVTCDVEKTLEITAVTEKAKPPPATKKTSKRIKWKNKNISELQKDPSLHKALYKLLTYREISDQTEIFEQFDKQITEDSDNMVTDEEDNSLSRRLWKAHRIISNDQSKMHLLLPLLSAYLQQSVDEDLFYCTLDTIHKLLLESEIFRNSFIASFTNNQQSSDNPLNAKITELGYCPHALFKNPNIFMIEANKKNLTKKIRDKKHLVSELYYYLDTVPYPPDYIFDSEMDKHVFFKIDNVPDISKMSVCKTNLLSELIEYLSTHLDCNMVLQDHSCLVLLDILKVLALWCSEDALENFLQLLQIFEKGAEHIFNINILEKEIEILIILLKSETIRKKLSETKLLFIISGFLNVDYPNTSPDNILKLRLLIMRLFSFIAYLCPEGISLLKQPKFTQETVIFDRMILLLAKELEYLSSLAEFKSEEETRIQLVREIILVFNQICVLNGRLNAETL